MDESTAMTSGDESMPEDPTVQGSPRPPVGSADIVRKVVTVVFADVAGSTHAGEQIDPEATRAIMARYFAAMRDALERHGGTVEKFIGDAVMAVFGIPAIHEDDALRAVRAADEMRAILARFSVELETQQGLALGVRIGVNTGEVVAGDPMGQTLVTGDAVNVAARLEQAAPVGAVLLGAPTYRLVRDAVVVEAIEPLTLKGKAEPVPAYRLIAVTPGADALARRQDTVLVGRDAELTRLQGMFEDVATKRRSNRLTVLGAAGVGKTRLVAELARLVAQDATIVRGRCLPYGDGVTFWPVREMVAEAAGFSDRDDADSARSRIGALLSDAPDGQLVSERICQALGLSVQQASRDELFWAIRRFVAHLAAPRPAVIIFDDLQWAEATLLELIDDLVEQLPDDPILFVCSARPEVLDRRPTWAGRQLKPTTVVLEALTAAASERLLADLVGEGTLPSTLRGRLVSTAEGNPLFLQELIAGLIDEGRLRAEEDGWVIVGDLAEVAVPPTISALMAARLDHLGPDQRALMGHAAVIGRSFEREALLDMMAPTSANDVDALLGPLVRAGLLRHERARGSGYRFRQLLTRDLCYGGLSKELRAALHVRHAGWIQQRHADRVEEFDEILGYHLEQSHAYRRQLGASVSEVETLGREAARWLEAAGRRAFARQDAPAAETLLTRAASLLPDGDKRRFAVELVSAELHRQRGDLIGADAILVRVRMEAETAAARTIADRAEILIAWLRSSTDPAGWLDEAEAVTRDAEPRLIQAADDEGLSLLWGLRMDAAIARGHVTQAREAAERAIEHGDRSGDRWQIVRRSRASLAELSVVDETPIDAAETRCQDLLETVGGERRLEASILFSLGRLQAMRGACSEADASVGRGRALAADLGLLYGQVAGAEAAAFVAVACEDLVVADELLRDAHILVERRGDLRAATRIAAERAAVLASAGRSADASEIIDELNTRPTDESVGIETGITLAGVAAVLAARRGAATEARASADDAVAAVRESESPLWRARALALSGEALCMLGDDEGPIQVARAIGLLEAKGASSLAARLRATPGLATDAIGVITEGLAGAAGPSRCTVTLRTETDLADALKTLGLSDARPVITLVGGADGLTGDLEAALWPIFADCLSPLAQELGAAIVDGGSEAGVMRMIGRARAAAGHEYPLVGVSAAGTIGERGDGRRAPTDSNHTHLVVVPGEHWGDESPWLQAVARGIARGSGQVALLVNGGRVAHDEAVAYADSGIPVVLLVGSGRAADRLANQLERHGGVGETAGMTRVTIGDLETMRAVLSAYLAPSHE